MKRKMAQNTDEEGNRIRDAIMATPTERASADRPGRIARGRVVPISPRCIFKTKTPGVGETRRFRNKKQGLTD